MIRTKIRNIFGTRFSGALGKEIVAGSWKGHEYIRAYVKPSGVPSDRQMEQRTAFSHASELWQGLSVKQQAFYGQLADGQTGYNVFMGRATPAIRNHQDVETPMPITYVTGDGSLIPEADLIVLHNGRSLFVDSLKDGRGEIALTASDAPYAFVLRRGTQQDEVAVVKDLLEADVPLVLESQLLGIRLVLDVTAPPAPPTPPIPSPTGGTVVA